MPKINYTKVVTPKGIAQYPWLHAPDTKFSEVGDYRTNLIISKDEAKDLISKIDTVIEEAVTLGKEKSKGKQVKQADPPYFDEVDDDGNPTGNVIFKFKCKAKITTKTGETFPNKPVVVDAKGKPVQNVNIWGGSEIKVSAELIPYFTSMVGAGVSMRLKAAQVLKLVEGNNSSFGFKEEEGYQHAPTVEEFEERHEEKVSDEEDF